VLFIKKLVTTGLTLLAFCALSAGPALAQTETFAYVTNADDGTVSVINPTDGSIVATISVGFQPYGIAAAPDGTRVYVANFGSSNVSVIDTATNRVVETVRVGPSPKGIAVTPDGTKVFVANNSYVGTVSVIDLTDYGVTTIPVGRYPSGIAFTPETPPRAYVTNTGSKNITVIDTARNEPMISSSVGGKPEGIAIDDDGIAYVALRNWGLLVMDTTNSNSYYTIRQSGTPVGVAVSGKRVYETDNGGGLLHIGDFSGVIPTWNTITIGPAPLGVAVTPDQSQAWVAISNEYEIPEAPGNVSIVDTAATSPAVLKAPIGTAGQPTWIAFATLDIGGDDPESYDFDLALKRIKILQRGRHKDYFWVNGKITLDPESDGLNLPEEDSSITIGPTTFEIPAGSFVNRARGRLLFFRGMVGETWLRVILFKRGHEGQYRVTVFGKKGAFPKITNPVTVGLVLGNDSGEAKKRAVIR